LARRVCRQAGELGRDSTTELWRCAEAFGDSGDLTQAEALAAKLDGMGAEDTIEQKVDLPLIRSIIERERGNAIRAADLLAQAEQYEWTLDVFYRRAQAYLVARELAKAAAEFEKLMGHHGWGWWPVYAPLAQLGLARANAMQGDHKKPAKPTTVSLPPGKTRTRISRYSVKQKLNIRNSPQPHLPALQDQGKNNNPVLRYSLLWAFDQFQRPHSRHTCLPRRLVLRRGPLREKNSAQITSFNFFGDTWYAWMVLWARLACNSRPIIPATTCR